MRLPLLLLGAREVIERQYAAHRRPTGGSASAILMAVVYYAWLNGEQAKIRHQAHRQYVLTHDPVEREEEPLRREPYELALPPWRAQPEPRPADTHPRDPQCR